MIPLIDINEYDFEYPENLVAEFPNPERDQSKLLHYNKGVISDNVFLQLPKILPPNSLLVFNDTKVIPARLFFKKETGAEIEIFLLKPISQDNKIWNCIVGNRAKFKEKDTLYNTTNSNFTAKWYDKQKNNIEFQSSDEEILDTIYNNGHIPLPPYIKRASVTSDSETYQTIFANHVGAVAAPTASLHFTKEVISQTKLAGHKIAFCTLHVGLGTFLPVKSQYIHDHIMHSEDFFISQEQLNIIINHDGPIIPVGTTSMRVLESLGVLAFQSQILKQSSNIVNTNSAFHSYFRNFERIQINEFWKNWLHQSDSRTLHGSTQLLIAPGYPIKLSTGIITNFHQPKSTLLLLIAALVDKNWKCIYNHALQNQYKLFSYGDSSLIIP